MIKYFKTLWENNITPVNGRNLNKIEDALEYLYDVIRNVPSEENVRIANEKQRQKDETTRSNSEIKRNATFDSKIKDVDKAINASNENIREVNNKFESITASKQQDAEVILSRDGEVSLPARLQRDLYVDNIPLKQKVLDIEGLKEMQDLEYETNSGYKVCKNTKNGVVKDLKLYGKSLVNVTNGEPSKQGSCTFDSIISTLTQIELKVTGAGSCVILRNGVFKRNTDYTIVAKVKYVSDVNDLSFSFKQTNGSFTISQTNVKKYNNTDYANYIIKLNTSDYDIESIVIGYHGSLPIGSILGVKDVLVLEGDHTQNPPSYFEGITSVGNGNEIEVLSRKEDGNLLEENIKLNVQVPVFIPKGEYTVSCKTSSPVVIRYYRKDMSSIDYWSLLDKGNGVWSRTFTSNEDIYYVLMQSDNAKDIILNKGSIIKPYMPCKQDKKPILFKDADGNWKHVAELRGIDLVNCDVINGSSSTYDKKIDKIVINGSENWNIVVKNNIVRGDIPLQCKYNVAPLSDKFKGEVFNDNDYPYIGIGGSDNLFLGIDKSKLETHDVQGFTKYLQNNNIIVYYAKKEIETYKVSPLDLEAFENETMWMIESGPVSPHTEFKVTSSIQNFAKNTAERVDRLEDEVYKMNLANFAVSLNALELKSRLEALEAPQK